MPLPVGTRLGRYEVRSLLGEGGMGEVYLALDTQLDRNVALKVLPAELAADQQRLRRFLQEARAASKISGSHAAHIYEIGEEGGTHFIAMEYVEGEPLSARIGRGRLTPAEVADFGAQIARALEEAHARGVTHRDIKPQNVVVTPGGQAKVLDFGLAKLAEAGESAEAATRVKTDTGLVMGTVSYMSPEQALGRGDIDHRTDIFSLGVVLYEMATGRLPFAGASVTETIDRIIHAQPEPVARFSYDAPADLELIIKKALRKDREERYQSARDISNDLRTLVRELGQAESREHSFVPEASAAPSGEQAMAVFAATGSEKTSVAPQQFAPTAGAAQPRQTVSSAEYVVGGVRRHKWGVLAALALVVAVAGLGFALYRYASREEPAAPVFQSARLTRVTTSGRAGECSISPDGKYIAYKEEAEDGTESLWVRQTATGNTLQIVPPARASIGGTTFSPDGNFVYYLFSDLTSEVSSLYQVPSIGGSPKKVIADLDSPVAVSPDGRSLAFVREERDFRYDLVVANADGTGERVLATREDTEWFPENGGPAWSPDGRTIACAAGANVGGDNSFSLVGVDVGSGAIRELSPKRWLHAGRAAWMPDGRAILLLALDRDNWQLWRVSLPGGEASPVTNFLSGSGQTSLGVTADGRKVVTVSLETVSQVWTVPASGDTGRAKQVTSGAGRDGHRGLDWTPDGRIVFSSYDGSQSDIWIMNADGSNRRRLTSDDNRDYSLAASPDGRYVVFETYRSKSNTTDIWRMDLDGGNLTQLTGVEDQRPHVSPDGRWVVFQSWVAPALSLWKVSIDGGDPVRLTDYLSSDPVFSPDGNWLAFTYYDEGVTPKRWRNAVIPASGRVRPIKLFDRPNFTHQHVRWTADGRHLSYVGPPAIPSNIWLQPVEGGEPRKLTDFKSETIYRHAWSRDGKWIALARGSETFDVVLMSDER